MRYRIICPVCQRENVVTKRGAHFSDAHAGCRLRWNNGIQRGKPLPVPDNFDWYEVIEDAPKQFETAQVSQTISPDLTAVLAALPDTIAAAVAKAMIDALPAILAVLPQASQPVQVGSAKAMNAPKLVSPVMDIEDMDLDIKLSAGDGGVSRNNFLSSMNALLS